MSLLDQIIQTFLEAAPYLTLGLLFSGLIQSFISKDAITKWIGQKNLRSVFLAAAAGVPLPLCSCGVIPMAVSLRKNGASRGATTAFLISTPETGLDSIMLSFALLDPLMAIFRPIAAFITALLAGILENFFDRSAVEQVQSTHTEHADCCSPKKTPASLPWPKRLAQGLQYSFVTLLGDIAPWLIFGLGLSGVISYAVPSSIIEQFLGPGLGSMLLMLVVGIPLYICASASTPIAASLLLKGAAPGAALVFLLAGPATNVTTMVTVYKFLGARALVTYLSSIAICSLGFGYLLNYLYSLWQIDIKAVVGQAAHCIDMKWQIASAIVLIICMMYALVKKYFIQGDTHDA